MLTGSANITLAETNGIKAGGLQVGPDAVSGRLEYSTTRIAQPDDHPGAAGDG